MSNLSVTIDWKFVVALGASAVERVSTQMVNACKEFAIAEQCNC